MKYKVGDKVKVRSDLKCEEYYGGVLFASKMNRFKGMEFTITRVNNGGYYEVLETIYNFTDEMLEPVEEMSAEEAIKIQAEMCKASCVKTVRLTGLDVTHIANVLNIVQRIPTKCLKSSNSGRKTMRRKKSRLSLPMLSELLKILETSRDVCMKRELALNL